VRRLRLASLLEILKTAQKIQTIRRDLERHEMVRSRIAYADRGTHGALFGIACTSATACIAVGSFDNSAERQVLLVEALEG
jgi:hypothetical protein